MWTSYLPSQSINGNYEASLAAVTSESQRRRQWPEGEPPVS